MTRASISLEMIYEDEPFLDRIDRVAAHGFDTVEFGTWSTRDLDAIAARVEEHDISVHQIAATRETPLQPEALDRALTDPTKQEAVVADIEASVAAADRLDCPNLVVLVGPALDAFSREEMYDSVVTCLREAAPAAEAAGVTLVVEPLNTTVDHPGYFLASSSVGFDVVREVESPAVKLLFVVYHQQVSEGNLIDTMSSNLDDIGHVHVADVPGRHEPGTGELHYANILDALSSAGYDGHVGFEYRPAGDDDRALAAIRNLVTG